MKYARLTILACLLASFARAQFCALPVPQVGGASAGNPNLVGWWKLDGNGTDSSGYGNIGTLVGSPTNATDRLGVMGGALSFSGSGQYANIADTAGLNITNRPLTITAWLYRRSTTAGYIVSRTAASAATMQYGVYALDNTIVALLGGGTALVSAPITPGYNWVHVAVTWRSDGFVSVYTNSGLSATSTVAQTNTLTTRANMKIAARSSAEDGSSVAVLISDIVDDVRIYKQELTQAQIATAMAGGQP